MQNKPNFRKSQMNVSSILTTAYENKSNWTLGENKPKQSQSKPIKPNTNPKQTQFTGCSNERKLSNNKEL